MEISTNLSTSTEDEVVKAITLHGLSVVEHCLVDTDLCKKYEDIIESERLAYPVPKTGIDPKNWFIPDHYRNMDIEGLLVDLCPEQNRQRLLLELELFKKNKMLIVLKAMKYLVDTMRANDIVWGVGRGSSVASYALFLLGVHKIDSVKYNLPIEEFFKGEK